MADMSYPESALHVGTGSQGIPVAGGVRIYPPGPNPQAPSVSSSQRTEYF